MSGRKPNHERVDIDLFLETRDSEFSELYNDLTWYTLDKVCELKLGSKHKLRTLKQKRDWCEQQGWQIIANKQGVEGCAFQAEEAGTMKMRVGSRFSADRLKRERFETREAGQYFLHMI